MTLSNPQRLKHCTFIRFPRDTFLVLVFHLAGNLLHFLDVNISNVYVESLKDPAGDILHFCYFQPVISAGSQFVLSEDVQSLTKKVINSYIHYLKSA